MGTKEENMSALSQVVAVMVKNLLMLLVGMSAAYVGLLIPALTDPNSNETIYLNEAHTSWTSAIIPIASLSGSVFSGAITEPLGRKGSMMILTIPCLIAWVSYYFAEESWQIFAILALLGITNGLIEAPVLTYVAEVTEPRLRGILSTTTLLFGAFGAFLEFFIGSVLHWRTAALATCAVPIITFCLLSRLPETPYWLLSKNKPDEARRCLAWLRGWTTVANIEEEFKDIQKTFNRHRIGVDNASFENNGGQMESSIKMNPLAIKNLIKRNFLCPFSLMAFLFIWANFIGIGTTQAFTVVILSTFKVPVDKYYATVLLGSVRVVASIVCIYVVRLYGKRKTALASAFGFCICNACIGIYAYVNDITHLNFTNDTSPLVDDYASNYKWVILLLFIAFVFIGNCGAVNLPWTLIGEVFTNETRATGCGLSTSFHYISAFVANFIYLDMIGILTLAGVYGSYAFMCVIGLVVIYFLVPETDGRTLEDVANHFESPSKLSNSFKRKSIDCRNNMSFEQI